MPTATPTYRTRSLSLLGLGGALALLGAACSSDATSPVTDDEDTTEMCTRANDPAVPGAPLPMSGGADDDVAPSPPSIGADVPVTYFGPPPSSVNRNLVGPYQLLKSGKMDLDAGTITLPLYEGVLRTEDEDDVPFWYIVTDSDDGANAEALGLNHASKLTFAASNAQAVRDGDYDQGGKLIVDRGAVDFSPEHSITPGAAPNLFPPASFTPGAVGDEDYSPLVKIHNAGDHIYNAPIVAFGTATEDLDFCDAPVDHSLLHDKVVRFCPSDGTVTLSLIPGFSFGRPVLYLSMESSVDVAAALENVTFAPTLGEVPTGRDDSLYSAVERLFAFTNGPMGIDNPQRQGFNSALAGEGSPLNTLGGIPTVATDYSPLWDVNIGEWTEAAIAAGYRSRQFEEFAILGLAARGFITGPGGAPFGSAGPIVNCPIVFRFL